MKILFFLLVAPAISAQRYREHVNPNDEPFLPIHPVYPYNPKLTKRGFDKEIVTVLKPELYAPRTDSRDSYTASYAGNPKDSYFPGYGASSPHGSTPPYSPYSSYYGNNLYGGVYMNPYNSNPYTSNAYGANPYTSGAHSSNSFPGYYHQPPYYYPDYYNQPFPYSFPSQDHSGPPGLPWNENLNSNQEYSPFKSDKPRSSKPKVKEYSGSSSNESRNQFVDGNNLISQSFKDLGTKSIAYKTSNPYNQLEQQMAELHFKNIPIPPTTYKVISVGGQLVGPNYPLPSTYARAQLLEQATAVKNLAKSLGHLFPHQMTRVQGPQVTSSHLPGANGAGRSSFLGKPDQEKIYSFEQNPKAEIQEGRYYSENLSSSGESDVAHVYGPDERGHPDKESDDQFVTVNQDSPSELSDIQIYGDRNNNQNNAQADYAIGQADKGQKMFSQNPGTLIKSPSKYQSLPYIQKPGTRVTFQRSESTYIPPSKNSPVLEDADLSSIQSHDQPSSLSDENYRQDQMQSMIPYQNIGQGTPQAYTYHQTNTLPLQKQQQQQQHKTNLDDVNFGAKQGNKR